MSDGRDIPEAVKLLLRQEAGFGCSRCGNPVVQYHHILGREREDPHDPAHMMPLCVEHHDMCTKGAVTEEEQRACKANPVNIAKGWADGRLKVNQDFCAIALGPNTFFDRSIPFSVDGTPLLAISIVEERLSLDLSLLNEKDDLLVEIAGNEWISGESGVWDLWSSYQQLKVRTKRGDIRLGIDARVMPMELRAKLMKNGKVIDIGRKGITTNGEGANVNLNGAAVCGLAFEMDTVAGVVTIKSDKNGAIKIEPDPRKRLEWGLAQMTR